MVSVADLSPQERALIRELYASGVRTPSQVLSATRASVLPVVDHIQRYFYIPETGRPMVLEPFQRIITNIAAGEHSYPTLLPFYTTVEYSTGKKSGKTAWSGAYARAKAESRTLRDEILFFANDETQAKGRGYAALRTSIELDPLYDEEHRVLRDEQGNTIWRVTDKQLEHVPTGTLVKPVNVDYRGEAGANPTLTTWTEAWGYDTEKQELLYDEMTPVLTRLNSQRVLEGYAGYTGRSLVLEKAESLLTNPDKGGRQLTLDDVPDWPWPDEELLPLYVNDQAGAFGYIERGLQAVRRRMPWLQGERGDRYYAEQELTLNDPRQFTRLHENQWISPVDSFIPLEVWNQCADASVGALEPWRSPLYIQQVPEIDEKLDATNPDHQGLLQLLAGNGIEVQLGERLLDLYMKPWNWAIVGDPVAIVLAGDASVTGDCTALAGCSRHPQRHQDCVLRLAWKWDPPRGGKIDYDVSPNAKTGLSFRQQLIKTCMEYNVVEFAYDEWQLHHLTNELRREAVVWCRPFKQGVERDVADKQLHDLIMGKRIAYGVGIPESTLCLTDIGKHLAGASRTIKPHEDTKLHIVKANAEAKIDLVVALSMASGEALRLDL